MAIWKHIRNSTPYKLCINGSPEGTLSNHGIMIAEISVGKSRFRISKKPLFGQKYMKIL